MISKKKTFGSKEHLEWLAKNKPSTTNPPEDEAEKYAGNNMRIVGEPHECDSTREDLQQAHLAGQAVGEKRKQAEIKRLNALLKRTEYMLLKADEREESSEQRGYLWALEEVNDEILKIGLTLNNDTLIKLGTILTNLSALNNLKSKGGA